MKNRSNFCDQTNQIHKRCNGHPIDRKNRSHWLCMMYMNVRMCANQLSQRLTLQRSDTHRLGFTNTHTCAPLLLFANCVVDNELCAHILHIHTQSMRTVFSANRMTIASLVYLICLVTEIRLILHCKLLQCKLLYKTAVVFSH
jgi:hypothetical protein